MWDSNGLAPPQMLTGRGTNRSSSIIHTPFFATTAPSQATWTPGIYILFNARSKTAADLSGHDRKTVIAYEPHGNLNQQWEFAPSGNGYTIRCLDYPSGHAIYLTVEGKAKENAVVVATASGRRTEWNVEQTSEGLRYVIFRSRSTSSWAPPSSTLPLEAGRSCRH